MAISCSIDRSEHSPESNSINGNSSQNVYDERNYPFTLIKLWGQDAAVVDKGNYYMFQGDIRLSKKDSMLFSGAELRGAAVLGRAWPNNTIYYSLDEIPRDQRDYIYEAIHWIESGSYIQMSPRYNERDYINFKLSSHLEEGVAAYSDYIGRKGGKQEICISTAYADHVGVIAHEICHAIGMFHEQCRVDRDKYVKINFSKLASEEERYQYKTYADIQLQGADIGPFDFGSIMLYSSMGVMYKTDGGYIYGQRDSLSYGDMKTLAFLQPLGRDYSFMGGLRLGDHIYEDYFYQNTADLQCPEGLVLDLRFQFTNDPAAKTYRQFSASDFDIYAVVSIVNKINKKEVYRRRIALPIRKEWQDLMLKGIHLSPGGYTTKLILTGEVKGENTAEKRDVLKTLLYAPHLYLYIDRAVINGEEKNIPNEFGNPMRSHTFIQI